MAREAAKVSSLTQSLLQYRAMLFGFIYSLVRDVNTAEEIFQEVAVVALEKERKGDEVIREPARWLKEVVRRLVQAGFRTRQGRAVSVDPEYLQSVVAGFEETTHEPDQERLDALAGCLEQVAADNRDLLRRRYVQGDSYDEIAKAVQRKPGALRVTVHRVQRLLADCVEQKLA